MYKCLPGLFSLPVSLPSAPVTLQPMEYSEPSDSNSTACRKPDATSLMFLCSMNLLRNGTGTMVSSIPPIPNCPSEVLPQQNILYRNYLVAHMSANKLRKYCGLFNIDYSRKYYFTMVQVLPLSDTSNIFKPGVVGWHLCYGCARRVFKMCQNFFLEKSSF